MISVVQILSSNPVNVHRLFFFFSKEKFIVKSWSVHLNINTQQLLQCYIEIVMSSYK